MTMPPRISRSGAGVVGIGTDERGVALPMAMLALLILSSLVIGFSVLSASEPVIANNQLLTAQARMVAEAGVERAIWALQNPDRDKGIQVPGAVPAPYDGSELVPVSTQSARVGGFRVTVTSGQPSCPSVAQRCITAVGWVPNDGAGRPRAQQKIAVTVSNPRLLFKDPPAALMVRGDLHAGGQALIDSRADTTCGRKSGSLTTGTISLSGAADVYGALDENDIPNQVSSAGGAASPPEPADVVTNVAATGFDEHMWTDADISLLRVYAKAQGTYLQGTVTFDARNPIPNGLVFVDTASGKNISPEGVAPATADSDLANVDVVGSAAADPSGTFHGWLFVNGGLSISGGFRMQGLVYAQNDIRYLGTGGGGIDGVMISRNIRGPSPTRVESGLRGRADLSYSCALARTGGNSIPSAWTMTPGTYRELCDSCAS
jgi:hypothetical protein